MDLTNGLSKFFSKGKPGFSNSLRNLGRSPPDYTILESLVFDNFVLADGLFTKFLRSFNTCL